MGFRNEKSKYQPACWQAGRTVKQSQPAPLFCGELNKINKKLVS